MFIIY